MTAYLVKGDSRMIKTARMLKGPWRITFDTNPDDCNLHCIMCEEHSEYSQKQVMRTTSWCSPRRMDIRIIEKVIEEALPLGLKEIIPSTMGEPLLYKYFDRIIDLCINYGLKMNLTTNGTFPKREAKEWAEKLVPILSDIKVSWNGAKASTAERIMKGIKFNKALQNVKDFIKIRDEYCEKIKMSVSFTFQLTFMEINLQEIPDIVKLATNLGVDRVKGHHLWINFPSIKHLSLKRDSESIIRWNDIVDKTRKVVSDYLLPSGKQVILENFCKLEPNTGDIPGDTVCPFLGKEAWVSATGRFDPCCAPDDLRKTLGYYGNLTSVNLKSIWESNNYRDLCYNSLNYDVCRKCNMRKPV